MPYQDRFLAADDFVNHLDSVAPSIADPVLLIRYSGFLAVNAVTVYELAIKDIFGDFALRKNKVFYNFVEQHFHRINGQILKSDLTGKHLNLFGVKYVDKFKKNLELKEQEIFLRDHKSIESSYQNIVHWRHGFVHNGILPTQATYREVSDSYRYGKIFVECLADSMKR